MARFMILSIKVIAGASKNSLEGLHEGRLKIKLRAVREKGKANEELISFLAEILKIPKRKIAILSGFTSSLKKIEIQEESPWIIEKFRALGIEKLQIEKA